jgi:hypothetical protein
VPAPCRHLIAPSLAVLTPSLRSVSHRGCGCPPRVSQLSSVSSPADKREAPPAARRGGDPGPAWSSKEETTSPTPTPIAASPRSPEGAVTAPPSVSLTVPQKERPRASK